MNNNIIKYVVCIVKYIPHNFPPNLTCFIYLTSVLVSCTFKSYIFDALKVKYNLNWLVNEKKDQNFSVVLF